MSGETMCECGHAESRHEERQDFDGYPSFIFCTDCIGNAVHPFRRVSVNAWHKPAWDDIPPGDGKWHPRPSSPPPAVTGEAMTEERDAEWTRRFVAACDAMPDGCTIISTAALNEMEAEIARLRASREEQPAASSVVDK